MAGGLKFPYICLSIFLLVLPLVYSEDKENNGKNEMEELLQNLLKAAKERRQQSDDTNAEGSGGTGQGQANNDESLPEIKTEKESDGEIINEVSVNKQLQQEIVQDCTNKYELLLDKDFGKSAGSCYLHKMNDAVYQKDCQGIGNISKINVDYKIGNIIENKTLLSSIKGIEGCTGRNVTEMIEVAVKKRYLNEYERRLAEKRGGGYCSAYGTRCNTICLWSYGFWWSNTCLVYGLECSYYCAVYCTYD